MIYISNKGSPINVAKQIKLIHYGYSSVIEQKIKTGFRMIEFILH